MFAALRPPPAHDHKVSAGPAPGYCPAGHVPGPMKCIAKGWPRSLLLFTGGGREGTGRGGWLRAQGAGSPQLPLRPCCRSQVSWLRVTRPALPPRTWEQGGAVAAPFTARLGPGGSSALACGRPLLVQCWLTQPCPRIYTLPRGPLPLLVLPCSASGPCARGTRREPQESPQASYGVPIKCGVGAGTERAPGPSPQAGPHREPYPPSPCPFQNQRWNPALCVPAPALTTSPRCPLRCGKEHLPPWSPSRAWPLPQPPPPPSSCA